MQYTNIIFNDINLWWREGLLDFEKYILFSFRNLTNLSIFIEFCITNGYD